MFAEIFKLSDSPCYDVQGVQKVFKQISNS